jgi:CHASE3 domain sensor protein
MEISEIRDESDRLSRILEPASEQSQQLLLAEARASAYLTEYALSGKSTSIDQLTHDLSAAETTLDDLQRLAQDIPDLLSPLRSADETLSIWILTDVEPTVAAVNRGSLQTATVLTTSPDAERTYIDMINASSDVMAAIDQQRAQLAQHNTRLVNVLRLSLVLTSVLIVIIAIAVLWATHAWVLSPLTRFIDDLNKVTMDRFHRISFHGPPEFQAAMRDAESMRRSLVSSEDSAEAAWTGLTQEAPLAAALSQHFVRTGEQHIDGLDVCGVMHGLEGVVAGDWWDVFRCSDRGVGFVIGDVAGHGDHAAILAVQMQAVLRGALRSGAQPSAALHQACEAVPTGAIFFTAIVGIVDTHQHAITIANAGHPSAIYLHGNSSSLIGQSGPLVSALGGTWQDITVPWRLGDRLICVTDGLAMADGEPDIAPIFLELPDALSVSEQVTGAMARLRSASFAWSNDDVTLVMLRQSSP